MIVPLKISYTSVPKLKSRIYTAYICTYMSTIHTYILTIEIYAEITLTFHHSDNS